MASERGMKIPMRTFKAGWPNGKALDYESRDCRFDPCVGHIFLLLSFLFALLLEGDMVRLDWWWVGGEAILVFGGGRSSKSWYTWYAYEYVEHGV
ncbi:hypothetical protein N7530_008565 [Penicillium desertorum]|uniref:Uncharacterized protein n=1 Tax=Penicillium desertorum TaxID=1303715 RepID=A0A9W9WPE8_9EURO|nr:hypothetical protein N7530_008565 [Penicillium desertorum]